MGRPADRRVVALAVALGGAAGSTARWSVEQAWPVTDAGFPWATLAINVSGCALLGLLMVLIVQRRPHSRYLRPALGTGVLGGFTTFSTAMAESRALIVHGLAPIAACYLLASVLAGLLGVWGGTWLGRLSAGARPGAA